MSTQPLVLVADDEPRITKLVAIALSEEGFRVVTANGGEQALQKAEEVRPDIVLLDIVMPDLDGIEVMRQLRERRPVPVILLTAKGSTADKAKGLDLGADDYIAKPFHPDELAARVRAVIRRSGGAEPGAGVIKFDDVEIDLERRMVTRGGELVQLSRTEWLLLQHLAANAGKVVLHTELLTKVWGPEYRDDLQYLRVWVSRVRRKLGAAPGEPGRIRTFQGIGYLLDVEGRERTQREEPAADVPSARPPRSSAELSTLHVRRGQSRATRRRRRFPAARSACASGRSAPARRSRRGRRRSARPSRSGRAPSSRRSRSGRPRTPRRGAARRRRSRPTARRAAPRPSRWTIARRVTPKRASISSAISAMTAQRHLGRAPRTSSDSTARPAWRAASASWPGAGVPGDRRVTPRNPTTAPSSGVASRPPSSARIAGAERLLADLQDPHARRRRRLVARRRR